jgi:DNA-binding CsgD family transcriptional regulator
VGVEDLVRARDRLIAAVPAVRAPMELLRDVLASLHDVARFEACALILTDPETMLPSAALVEGFPGDSCVPFWDNELLDPDFLKFNDLARSHDPVGTLHDATDGDPERSPRFNKIIAPGGYGDELRVAFTSGMRCWAAASILRPTELGPFSPEEVRAVRDLLPVASRSLRHVLGGAHGQGPLQGPAMVVIATDGTIESMTPDAEAAIADMGPDGVDMDVPTPILAAAVRAKNNRTGSRIALRARGVSGSWMKLHAASLGDDGRVAVMIEPARPTDLVPILLESYGCTARETEVVFLISRGLSTKEIAAEMCISAHTVNDHIKVIFSKVGVSSRGELVARLFSEHVVDAYHEAAVHV